MKLILDASGSAGPSFNEQSQTWFHCKPGTLLFLQYDCSVEGTSTGEDSASNFFASALVLTGSINPDDADSADLAALKYDEVTNTGAPYAFNTASTAPFSRKFQSIIKLQAPLIVVVKLSVTSINCDWEARVRAWG